MNIKIPNTENPVSKFIINRWSPRAFNEKAISRKDLNTILEAASWAPSANNEQPWRYIVALRENHEAFETLVSILNPSNAVWAKHAAALLLSYCKLKISDGEAENPTAMHDTGMANQNLLLQALDLGIYGHVMGGFDKQKAIDTLGLTNDYKPICMIALGYPGTPDQLDEPFKTRELTPRNRKPLSEFVKIL
ncbi:MAG TPA: nitroreductase family protein [Cytophagaceae bacterium]